VVDLVPSSFDPTLSLESEVQVIDMVPSSIDPTLSLKSEVDTGQVFLVTLDSSRQGEISPISMEPPPSIEVISFYWNKLMAPHLPCYFHFKIISQVCDINICQSVIDEGTFVSILSSNA